jgi:hypothetical protein
MCMRLWLASNNLLLTFSAGICGCEKLNDYRHHKWKHTEFPLPSIIDALLSGGVCGAVLLIVHTSAFTKVCARITLITLERVKSVSTCAIFHVLHLFGIFLLKKF